MISGFTTFGILMLRYWRAPAFLYLSSARSWDTPRRRQRNATLTLSTTPFGKQPSVLVRSLPEKAPRLPKPDQLTPTSQRRYPRPPRLTDAKFTWLIGCHRGPAEQIERRTYDGRPVKTADGKAVMAWRAIARIHNLRHTYASVLASHGLSLTVIGALLRSYTASNDRPIYAFAS